MLNLERQDNYAAQRGSPDSLILPSPAQFRRMQHKQSSRKTHQHLPGTACARCKPGWIPAAERRRLEAEQQA